MSAELVMLQINVAGAWRNVCRFDVSTPAQRVRVLALGGELAQAGFGQPDVRITADGRAAMLQYHRADGRWRWAHGAVPASWGEDIE